MELLSRVIQTYHLLSDNQLEKAIRGAQFKNQPLITYLIQQEILSSKCIAESCGRFYHLPYKNLKTYSIKNIKNLQLKHKNFTGIILEKKTQYWTVAITQPKELKSLNEFQWQTNITFAFVFVEHDLFMQYKKALHPPKITQETLENTANTYIKLILQESIEKKASDIHFEPHKFQYRIRIRVDGFLYELRRFDISVISTITSCLKIMANLDIAESRLPQDGRFIFRDQNNISHPCRISTCNTIFGEKCVIRILEINKHLLKFAKLGLTFHQQKIFINALKKMQGLILVTGPTGSGKTITLYTALQYLNKIEKNIYSAEDPVEIELLGIHQMNINLKIGLTFAKALRAFLRQDPDIMMIGEIRDVDTAHTAIRAAQTGHLVLSTLHTNNAIETLKCLEKMKIHPFDLAGTLQLIVAQRLVRKLCQHCKIITQSNESIAKGCSQCVDGYQGRIGIYELVPISDEINKKILTHATLAEIENLVRKEGVQSLYNSGLKKVSDGITSLIEIQRILC